jgi:hypothetical protein
MDSNAVYRLRQAIKKKDRALKGGLTEAVETVRKQFAPLTEPLHALISMKKERAFKTSPPSTPPPSSPTVHFPLPHKQTAPDRLQQEFIDLLLTGGHDIDTTYGVYFDPEKGNSLRLGSKEVTFIGNRQFKIDGTTYRDVGRGVYELMFLKSPQNYSEDDKKVYRQILLQTNAHRRGHNPSNQRVSSKASKYREIIGPLTDVSGSGMQRFMQNIDYVHWDDPNELVTRLRLLLASQHAGNTGHKNEIYSIIEELREANIIKGGALRQH